MATIEIKRTACFYKEKLKTGTTAIMRIPFDLCEIDGQAGQIIRPVPVIGEGVDFSITNPRFHDMIYDDRDKMEIYDPIIKFQFFDSLEEFYRLTDGLIRTIPNQ